MHHTALTSLTAALLLAATGALQAQTPAEKTLTVRQRYLNIPVSHAMGRAPLSMQPEGGSVLNVEVRIAEGKPDYWVFKDLSAWQGRRLTLRYNGTQEALDKVFQADTIVGQAALYRERLRPQFHFTTRRGWTNDPNGLVWHNGIYHLYYQHNPYDRDWGNMHWGHAVSRDLVHWEELDDALFPDALGAMFSGSAVVDKDNTSGWGTAQNPPIVYAYTAHGARQTQCMAYSLDGGRTLVKYAGNPVIDSGIRWNSGDTRDPRLLWYAPGKHWVMVLFERGGHSIYTSQDLRNWAWQSHLPGFWECPDLFELPVDGDPSRTKWVMYGASGSYLTGDFDGKTFTPDGPKRHYTAGKIYASQTFSDTPDGRRIQIGWGQIEQPGMPFNCQMQLPTELTLRTTKDGIRLCSRPVTEVEGLLHRQFTAEGPLDEAEASAALNAYAAADGLHIHARLHLRYATSAGLILNNEHLVLYDASHDTVNGWFYGLQDPASMALEMDVYIDRTGVEVFLDGGLFSWSAQRRTDGDRSGFRFWGTEISISDLRIDTVDSIWNDRPLTESR